MHCSLRRNWQDLDIANASASASTSASTSASDGYQVVFSWSVIFNSSAAERMRV